MIVLWIELAIEVVFMVLSCTTYYYRRKTFRNTIIRKRKSKQNSYFNYVVVVLITVILLIYLTNWQSYFGSALENSGALAIISTNQLFFWSSILVLEKSLKFVRKEQVVEFYHPSKRESGEGEVLAGKVTYGDEELFDYFFKLVDLQRHMFINGKTGSGKSNWFQYFITNFKRKYDTPILLAEFKGEYRGLQRIIPDLLVYKVGEDGEGGFCINIFDPHGTDSDVHAERIFQIFRSGGLFEGVDYSPQMERVFVEVLKGTCSDPVKRNWDGFKKETEAYLLRPEIRGDPTFKNSVTAIKNRIRRYSLGTIKQAFEKEVGLPVRKIFDHNVLLDLSSILNLGGEKEDVLFFLNLIFKYLWDMNIRKGAKNYKGIQHITILEDAQYFASQSTSKRSTISSYIEDIALLLRGTGECLVSLATRPAVSAEILANCGIFITFQNDMQKAYLQDLLNIDDKKISYLSMLPIGDCIVRVNSIGRPFSMRAPLMQRKWITDAEVKETNRCILAGDGKKRLEELREEDFPVQVIASEYGEDEEERTIKGKVLIRIKNTVKTAKEKVLRLRLQKEKEGLGLGLSRLSRAHSETPKTIVDIETEAENEYQDLMEEMEDSEARLRKFERSASKLGFEKEEAVDYVEFATFLSELHEEESAPVQKKGGSKKKIKRM